MPFKIAKDTLILSNTSYRKFSVSETQNPNISKIQKREKNVVVIYHIAKSYA